MSKLWTHPNLAGGCAQREPPSAGRNQSDTLLIEHSEFLFSFLMAGLLSACLTLGYFLVNCVHRGPDISIAKRSYDRSERDLIVRSLTGTGKDSFLAGMLSQQAFDLKRQIQFVSGVIRSHLNGRAGDEDLAYLIVSESFKANYDPLFVAAVIRSESMFRGGAISSVGARGLMQIMPKTGLFLSKRENIPIDSRRGLHDPHINLRLGIAYLKYLEEKFGGNRTRALIAYNWGPANLEDALRSRQSVPSCSLTYAQKIISTHKKWKNEYSQVAMAARNTIG